MRVCARVCACVCVQLAGNTSPNTPTCSTLSSFATPPPHQSNRRSNTKRTPYQSESLMSDQDLPPHSTAGLDALDQSAAQIRDARAMRSRDAAQGSDRLCDRRSIPAVSLRLCARRIAHARQACNSSSARGVGLWEKHSHDHEAHSQCARPASCIASYVSQCALAHASTHPVSTHPPTRIHRREFVHSQNRNATRVRVR